MIWRWWVQIPMRLPCVTWDLSDNLTEMHQISLSWKIRMNKLTLNKPVMIKTNLLHDFELGQEQTFQTIHLNFYQFNFWLCLLPFSTHISLLQMQMKMCSKYYIFKWVFIETYHNVYHPLNFFSANHEFARR